MSSTSRQIENMARRIVDLEAEAARLREERDAALRAPMRFCLNVDGDLLCNGPQGHEGGCVFVPGWKLAREIEDELAKMVAYAGATTNELRETRGAAEAAEAECARLQQALDSCLAWKAALAGLPDTPADSQRLREYVCAHDHHWFIQADTEPKGCPVCNTITFKAADSQEDKT